MRISPIVIVSVASALAGAALDFACNGVFKIVWFLIYVPIYLGAAHLLLTQLPRTRWARFSKQAVAGLLAGAALGHVLSIGHHRSVMYFMRVASDDPTIILRSSDWPQYLVVQSENLRQALPTLPSLEKVPVLIHLVSDYGCTRTFTIETIGGVDVHADPGASWTWRADSWTDQEPEDVDSGPGSEDRALPWCRIRFY